MSEKLEDRVVYCLVADENEMITLEIRQLKNIHILEISDDGTSGEEVDIERRSSLIEGERCGDYNDLGESLNEYYTFDESHLWFVVEDCLSKFFDLDLQDAVNRFAQFKVDGKFDGEEE